MQGKPCTSTHQTVGSEVDRWMQPQNETEECDAIDLLSCLMWKIIFMLQATSYSNFWNNWIPGGQWKSPWCFLILLWLLPWSTIPRLHEEKIQDFPCVSPTFLFGSRNLGEAETICILGLSCLYFWDEVVFQGSLLISSKPAISYYIAYSGSMKCSWALKSEHSVQPPAQCWCLAFFSKAEPMLNVKLMRRSCTCVPQMS